MHHIRHTTLLKNRNDFHETNEELIKALDYYGYEWATIKNDNVEVEIGTDCPDALYSTVEDMFGIGQCFKSFVIEMSKIQPNKKYSDRRIVFS